MYATYFDDAVPPAESQPMTTALMGGAGEVGGERNQEFDGANGFSLAGGICSSGGDMLQLPSPSLLSHEAPLLTPLPSVGSPLEDEAYRHLMYQHQQHMPLAFGSFEPPSLEMFAIAPIGEHPAASTNAHHIDAISQPFSSGSFIGLPEPEAASADEYADNGTAVVDLESPGPDSSATGFEIHTDDSNPSDSFGNGHFDQRST